MESDNVVRLESSHETAALSLGVSLTADADSDADAKSPAPPAAEHHPVRRRTPFQLGTSSSFKDVICGLEPVEQDFTRGRLIVTPVTSSASSSWSSLLTQDVPRRDFSIARLLDAPHPSSASRVSITVPMDLRRVGGGSGGLLQPSKPADNDVTSERRPADERIWREGRAKAAAAALLRRRSSSQFLGRVVDDLVYGTSACSGCTADELQRQMNDGRSRRHAIAQHRQGPYYDTILMYAIIQNL